MRSKIPLNLPSKLFHVLQMCISLHILIYFYYRSTCTQAEEYFVQKRKNKKGMHSNMSHSFYFYFLTIYLFSTSIYCIENLPYCSINEYIHTLHFTHINSSFRNNSVNCIVVLELFRKHSCFQNDN